MAGGGMAGDQGAGRGTQVSATKLIDQVEYMAFMEAVVRSTFGLAVHNNTGIGTGTLVSFGEKKFVLTAEHVIKDVDPSEIRYLVPPPAPLKQHSMLDGVPPEFNLPSSGDLFPVDGKVLINKTNDLAAIPLRSTALIPKYMRPFPIEICLDKIINDSSVLILGFPVDNSAEYKGPLPYKGQWNALGVTSEHVVFSEPLQTKFTLHSTFDPERHFLIEYSRVDDGITPYGFSGAAAWCAEMPNSPIWTAKPYLAGVFTSWHPKTSRQPHLLQGVQGYLVKRLFEQNF
jgi:hypothetical protein